MLKNNKKEIDAIRNLENFDPETPFSFTLTNQDFNVAQADVDHLNKWLRENGKNLSDAIKTVYSKNLVIGRLLVNTFGFNLHFIEGSNDPGMVLSDMDAAFITIEKADEYQPIITCGHEAGHLVQFHMGDIWVQARSKLLPLLNEEAYEDRKKIEENHFERQFRAFFGQQVEPLQEKPPECINNELICDVNGDMWIDSVFWQQMAISVICAEQKNIFEWMSSYCRDVPMKAYRGTLKGSKRSIGRAVLVDMWLSVLTERAKGRKAVQKQ